MNDRHPPLENRRRRPTADELQAAAGGTVPDVIAPASLELDEE